MPDRMGRTTAQPLLGCAFFLAERQTKDAVEVGGERAFDVRGNLEELRSEITGRSHGLASTEVV